eukprot:m51a1_g5628 putative phosphatidylinositol glycan, class N (903) ;mRNA; f:799195-802314
MARWAIVAIIGVAFHCAYMLSAFDVYFRSPIVHGMRPHSPASPPPARRLVVFVGDGLRADKFFEAPGGATRAPFLRSIVETRGAWGVSHARVPTESRPCHVAMLAGLYEDVSAVTHGWKSNPVPFDSVFNASDRAWGFGSPDIIPMFSLRVPHMHGEWYSADHEDFGVDAGHLDDWVFDKVSGLLNAAMAGNETLRSDVSRDRSVWFLHLLALDTLGHARKPHSPEYLSQITRVDAGVRRIHDLFEALFPDHSTAYLFTADHGMSAKGSHGDGEPENTRTPLVAWGAGVRGPLPADPSAAAAQDTPADWGLSHLRRSDVEQASITPLIASLTGIPFPANSVGELPIDWLGTDDGHKAASLYGNARQVLEMYRTKDELRRQRATWHTEYGPLADVERATASIEADLAAGRFKEAEEKSHRLIRAALEGLRYLQTYDWHFLMATVTSGYVLWVVYVAAFLVSQYGSAKPSAASASRGLVCAVLLVAAAVVAYLALQSAPAMYYVYLAFPVFFLVSIVSRLGAIAQATRGNGVARGAAKAAGYIAATACSLVVVSAFHDRSATSWAFLALALWPLVNRGQKPHGLFVTFAWVLLCVVCSLFPRLSTDLQSSPLLIAAGGALMAACYLASLWTWPFLGGSRSVSRMVVVVRLALLAVAVVVDIDSDRRQAKLQGLPLVNQVISWIVLGSALVPAPRSHVFDSLHAVFMQFAPAFMILSVSYEALFLGLLWCLLTLWVLIQVNSYGGSIKATPAPVRSSNTLDLWNALFYMFFCYASFFCTGNTASISSFDIASVYRLTTVFSPFLMAALLFFKLFMPFIFVACAYRTASHANGVPAPLSFLTAIALSGVPAAACFLAVRDTGSWKDIGTSIGHFAVSNIYILLQLLLMGLSAVLLPHPLSDKKKAN